MSPEKIRPQAASDTSRPFVKMHGLRNHFVIFDRRIDRRAFRREDIVRICDPQVGVGGDQLLTIEHPSEMGSAAGADAAMRIFNIDGREVSACGNATRCVAHLLLEETGGTELLLETGGGLLKCRRSGPMQVSVEMGPISGDWQSFPLAEEVDTTRLPVENGPLRDGVALWIGNPHAVYFVDSLAEIDLPNTAAPIQNHPLFPEGVNVGVAELVDDETIRLAVWERPGIATQACGTGACVAAFAARMRGLTEGNCFTVHLPAGALTIELVGDMAIMSGPVAYCCRGFVDCEETVYDFA
ncbi:diaminopimelate epimerase [Mesorhizobium soli]|uniref:diaminopimelate epimerase n=1 Tax=Pseudaminobacter soli (ex Li et al. 2025) TaxID=1295366 RepID=UPI002475C0D8|nr:diaminopimelate epimerase [Mesorhizobium soli]MDH6233534.1 diaminopimelate epimerase [Mesorhizobium soli]